MALEEQEAVETGGERCEACGVKLTVAELEAVLDSGGPVLCAVHADELVPVEDDGEPQ